MLKIMLCGSSETGSYYKAFEEVVQRVGGQAVSFQGHNFLYNNSQSSDFKKNSQRNVENADILVFLISRAVGDITWSIEFETALKEGKSIIVMAEKDIMDEYYPARKIVADSNKLRKMTFRENPEFDLIDRLEDRQISIVTFGKEEFKEQLYRQLISLYEQGLQLLNSRTKRENALSEINNSGELSKEALKVLEEIAVDENEEKTRRKIAIRALCSYGIEEDNIKLLIESAEEGVQRMCIEHLGELYRGRKDCSAFLDYCVNKANMSFDVGIPRRVVSAVLSIDLKLGIMSLGQLDKGDLGVRKEIVRTFENLSEAIISGGYQDIALQVISEVEDTKENFKNRIQELKDRLSTRSV